MLSPLDTSRRSIKKGSKSFSLAALFLPRTARPQVYALYSWCRACDDAVDNYDEPSTDGDRPRPDLIGIKNWALQDPVIQPLIESGELSETYFEAMILGMRMDIEHQGYENTEKLEIYCYRVAGVVGLMMCPLIGVRNLFARDHAVALGIAMQLTNICRDIFEDARRDRVYLPLPDLNHGDWRQSAQVLRAHPELGYPVAKKLLTRADELYAHGQRGFQFIPWRACFAIATAARIYQLIGHRLLARAKKDPIRAFRTRTVVPRYRKIWALIEALAFATRSRWWPQKTTAAIFPALSQSPPDHPRPFEKTIAPANR